MTHGNGVIAGQTDRSYFSCKKFRKRNLLKKKKKKEIPPKLLRIFIWNDKIF